MSGFLWAETDATPFFLQARLHQPTDSVEDDFELAIVVLLQIGKLSRQLAVGGEHLSKSNERSHHLDTGLNSSLGLEDVGYHDCTVLDRNLHRGSIQSAKEWARQLAFECSFAVGQGAYSRSSMGTAVHSSSWGEICL